MDRLTLFQKKVKKGIIDVWWLYDDGGKEKQIRKPEVNLLRLSKRHSFFFNFYIRPNSSLTLHYQHSLEVVEDADICPCQPEG